MSRAGRWSRKLPARTYSTSWHSAGEALSTDTARGRLLSAAIAMNFRALAATGGTNGEAPFLALAKVASTNASSRFSCPRSWGQLLQCLVQLAAPHPLLEPAVARLVRR